MHVDTSDNGTQIAANVTEYNSMCKIHHIPTDITSAWIYISTESIFLIVS